MRNKWIKIFTILTLTLGLAPFFPEPHIWGKLKWIAGGGLGMELADYFDTVLHGFPWFGLLIAVGYQIFVKK